MSNTDMAEAVRRTHGRAKLEASGGVKNQGMRYVLAISLALAVIAMSVMWIVPSLSR